MLSDENAALRFELRETRSMCESYRELSQVSLAALSTVTRERDQARRQLREVSRFRREQVMTSNHLPGAAA